VTPCKKVVCLAICVFVAAFVVLFEAAANEGGTDYQETVDQTLNLIHDAMNEQGFLAEKQSKALEAIWSERFGKSEREQVLNDLWVASRGRDDAILIQYGLLRFTRDFEPEYVKTLAKDAAWLEQSLHRFTELDQLPTTDERRWHRGRLKSVLFDVYGVKPTVERGLVLARKSDNEDMLIDWLRDAKSLEESDIARDAAIAGLESPSADVRELAHDWCIAHWGDVSDDVRRRVRQAVLKAFEEDARTRSLYPISVVATPADARRLRRVYVKRYKDATYPIGGEPTQRSAYSCTWIIHPSRITRGEILILLARLDDAAAKREIIEAIRQDDDPQQRAWGLSLAAEVGDVRLLDHVARAFDDARVVPEPIHTGPVSPDDPRRIVVYSCMRVSDVAVQAAYRLLPTETRRRLGFDLPDSYSFAIRRYQLEKLTVHEAGELVWNAAPKTYMRIDIVGHSEKWKAVTRRAVEKVIKP